MGITLVYWLAVLMKVYRTAGEVAPRDTAANSPNQLSSIDSLYLSKGNFYPGQLWLDTEGKPINAHGGGIFYSKTTAKCSYLKLLT
eukprot:5727739-Pyramimonas_sp.AAC.1